MLERCFVPGFLLAHNEPRGRQPGHRVDDWSGP
jgi:hypothetical protein